MSQGRRIRVRGQVQGVGFRPFVWQLAQRFGIDGRVLNDAEGVLIEAGGPVATPMGPTVAAGLVARDRLAGMDDDGVLDTAWRAAPDVSTETHARPGATDPDVILLRQGGGLGRTVRLDTLDAALVSVCDGELTARQSLAAISGLLDVPTGEALGRGVGLLRGLVADGFLTS